MAVNIQTIGVVGAGQMGNGIAHVCALAGFDVMLNDVAPDRIKASLATINGNMAKQVAKAVIQTNLQSEVLAQALTTCPVVIKE